MEDTEKHITVNCKLNLLKEESVQTLYQQRLIAKFHTIKTEDGNSEERYFRLNNIIHEAAFGIFFSSL